MDSKPPRYSLILSGMAKSRKLTTGEQIWNDRPHGELYKVYRRVERVAEKLQIQQKAGRTPLKANVVELFAIADKLKGLAKTGGRSPKES